MSARFEREKEEVQHLPSRGTIHRGNAAKNLRKIVKAAADPVALV
jgi:hypothetical protein